MKIKISRRKARQFRDRLKKNRRERKSDRTHTPSVADTINTPREFFCHFSFIPQGREWRKLNDKTSAHSIRNLELWQPIIWYLQHFLQSCIVFYPFFFSSFRYSFAKTSPRERFQAFLLQVPTKRCEPEMNCHKRNTNVIVMKKKKIRANS